MYFKKNNINGVSIIMSRNIFNGTPNFWPEQNLKMETQQENT